MPEPASPVTVTTVPGLPEEADALIDELAPPQAESVAARTAVSAQAPRALTVRRCGRRRACK